MFKLLILLTNFAMAEKSVTCDSAGCSYVGAGSTPVISSGSSTRAITFDNRIDGDNELKVVSGVNLDTPVFVIEGRNSDNTANLTIDMPSRFDRDSYGSNNTPSAPNVVGIFDSINNITVNLSGNVGNVGQPASRTCYDMATAGELDNQYATGSQIRDLIVNRRTSSHPSYDSAAPANRCDSIDITAIRNLLGGTGNQVACQSGFKAQSGWGNTELLNRIIPRRFCAPDGFAFDVKRCRMYTKRFYCGLIKRDGANQNVTYNGFRIYNPSLRTYRVLGGSAGAYTRTEVVKYDGSLALAITGTTSSPILSPLNSNPGVLTRGVATFDVLLERTWTSPMVNTTTRPLVIYSNSYASVVPLCKTRGTNIALPYPQTSIAHSGAGAYLLGQTCTQDPYTNQTTCNDVYEPYSYESNAAGTSTFFPIQMDEDINLYYETSEKDQSCDNTDLKNQVLAQNGYTSSSFPGGNPVAEVLSTIPGAAATYVTLDQNCPAGTRQFGVVRNHDACAEPDTETNTMTPDVGCDEGLKTENVQCSSTYCPEAITYVSNRSFKGVEFEIDGGENGSPHGRGNIFAFNFTGTITNISEKGADGGHGQNDLNVITENLTCSKAEDELVWKALRGVNPAGADINASYRSTPILTIQNVLFTPMTVKPSTKTTGVYQDPSVLDTKVWTHVDNNIRRLILNESK